MDELDRILLDEELAQPSSALAAEVMKRIRREDRRFAALPFPWVPLLVGLGTAAAVLVLTLLAAGSDPVTGADLARGFERLGGRSSLSLLAVLVVSSLSAYLPMRWIGA